MYCIYPIWPMLSYQLLCPRWSSRFAQVWNILLCGRCLGLARAGGALSCSDCYGRTLTATHAGLSRRAENAVAYIFCSPPTRAVAQDGDAWLDGPVPYCTHCSASLAVACRQIFRVLSSPVKRCWCALHSALPSCALPPLFRGRRDVSPVGGYMEARPVGGSDERLPFRHASWANDETRHHDCRVVRRRQSPLRSVVVPVAAHLTSRAGAPHLAAPTGRRLRGVTPVSRRSSILSRVFEQVAIPGARLSRPGAGDGRALRERTAGRAARLPMASERPVTT